METEADVVICPTADDEPTLLAWEVDPDRHANVVLDTPCRISDVPDMGSDLTILQLECGTGGMMTTHSIAIFSTPAPDLAAWEGTDVTLRYVSQPIWWVNRWFTLRAARSGQLLLAGVDAEAMTPPEIDPAVWYAPLGVRVASGVCPPADDRCGPLERQALVVSYGGASAPIFDGLSGYVGTTDSCFVSVAKATHFLEMDCEDVPDQFYTAVFVLGSGG